MTDDTPTPTDELFAQRRAKADAEADDTAELDPLRPPYPPCPVCGAPADEVDFPPTARVSCSDKACWVSRQAVRPAEWDRRPNERQVAKLAQELGAAVGRSFARDMAGKLVDSFIKRADELPRLRAGGPVGVDPIPHAAPNEPAPRRGPPPLTYKEIQAKAGREPAPAVLTADVHELSLWRTIAAPLEELLWNRACRVQGLTTLDLAARAEWDQCADVLKAVSVHRHQGPLSYTPEQLDREAAAIAHKPPMTPAELQAEAQAILPAMLAEHERHELAAWRELRAPLEQLLSGHQELTLGKPRMGRTSREFLTWRDWTTVGQMLGAIALHQELSAAPAPEPPPAPPLASPPPPTFL